MNWLVKGKGAKGREVTLTIVGGADDEKTVRKRLKGTRPTLTVESLTPLDGNLKPRTAVVEIARAEAQQIRREAAAPAADK